MEIKTKIIRKDNRKKIRFAFCNATCLSASQVRQATKLSIVTINAVLNDMIHDNEISLSNSGLQNPVGRPSAIYEYNRFFICGCILYAYEKEDDYILKSIVADSFGSYIYEKEEKVKEINSVKLETILEELLANYPTIKVLTLGLPGVENKKTIRSLDFAKNIEEGFVEKIEEYLAIKVSFVNDINAAIYGYYNSKDCFQENIVGIFFPKNFSPGAGIIINGEIYTGTVNFAGEIGNLPVKIPWNQLYKNSRQEIVMQIESMLSIIICVLAPKRLVLYSKYLEQSMIEDFLILCNEKYGNFYVPKIELCQNLDTDIKNGLATITQENIEKEYEEII